MKKYVYLSTCNTCQKILKTLELPEDVQLQNTKAHPLSEKEIDQLKTEAGSYEALLNRRAKLYQERGLKYQELSETDYKALLLEHYSFLKRPVLFYDNQVYIGNSAKTVEAMKKAVHPKL